MNNIVLYNCENCGKAVFIGFGTNRFCSRFCANKRIHSEKTKSKIAASVKATYIENGHIRRTCNICGKILNSTNKTGFCHICLHSDPIAKDLLTKSLSATHKGKCGGYRKGSGRGKKGTYKGYYCDSSWELAYVIYNLDHSIKFERNEELFPYEFNGEQHKYKPDFIENGIYVEIKGYFNEQVKAKEFAFPYQLKYIDKNTIKPYLEYVEQTYGKDFTRLYE